MGYRIRPANADDVRSIYALVLALAEYEQLTHLVTATEDDLREALFGRRAHVEALVAETTDADGRGEPRSVVGFALYFHNFSTFLGRRGLYLEDLFVLPAQRRRGIGRAMLARLAATAVERGCGRLEWSVLDWNSTAIAFYENIGATLLPDWRIVRMTGEPLRSLGGGCR